MCHLMATYIFYYVVCVLVAEETLMSHSHWMTKRSLWSPLEKESLGYEVSTGGRNDFCWCKTITIGDDCNTFTDDALLTS